jgi:integrase
MARSVRDSNLETRTARIRLKAGRKPHYRLIEPGLHLGYRRLISGPGTWVVRRYSGNETYAVKNLSTADGNPIVADDFSESDGYSVLSFAQAQERAKAQRVQTAAEKTGPYTVAMAMDDYLIFLESRPGAAGDDARYRDRAFIRPKLGTTAVADLTTDKLRKWLADLARAAPRLRTRKGDAQKHRELGDDDESKRRRQASANRNWTPLKAALNRAWREGKVTSDAAWRRVEPFDSVDAARVRYLSIAEAKRLLNACPPDFRRLVRGALQTGARFGQLAQLVASDFKPDSDTVLFRSRKGKGKEKIYHAVLTNEGAAFFAKACAGLAPSDLIFRKDDGTAWGKSHQNRPMAAACEHARIDPPIGIHQLRHTWGSHAVMAGVPLLVVAKNFGHSDTRMVEKHYGHLAPSYVADAIRAGAPRFGKVKPTNVQPMSGRTG